MTRIPRVIMKRKTRLVSAMVETRPCFRSMSSMYGGFQTRYSCGVKSKSGKNPHRSEMGKKQLRAIKPTFCPHGDPSSSINKTSSTPKMVCMCSTGLAIVAEQETNRTRRFPTAAQIRLSLGSNNAGQLAAFRLYQTPQPYAHLRITNATWQPNKPE